MVNTRSSAQPTDGSVNKEFVVKLLEKYVETSDEVGLFSMVGVIRVLKQCHTPISYVALPQVPKGRSVVKTIDWLKTAIELIFAVVTEIPWTIMDDGEEDEQPPVEQQRAEVGQAAASVKQSPGRKKKNSNRDNIVSHTQLSQSTVGIVPKVSMATPIVATDQLNQPQLQQQQQLAAFPLQLQQQQQQSGEHTLPNSVFGWNQQVVEGPLPNDTQAVRIPLQQQWQVASGPGLVNCNLSRRGQVDGGVSASLSQVRTRPVSRWQAKPDGVLNTGGGAGTSPVVNTRRQVVNGTRPETQAGYPEEFYQQAMADPLNQGNMHHLDRLDICSGQPRVHFTGQFSGNNPNIEGAFERNPDVSRSNSTTSTEILTGLWEKMVNRNESSDRRATEQMLRSGTFETFDGANDHEFSRWFRGLRNRLENCDVADHVKVDHVTHCLSGNARREFMEQLPDPTYMQSMSHLFEKYTSSFRRSKRMSDFQSCRQRANETAKDFARRLKALCPMDASDCAEYLREGALIGRLKEGLRSFEYRRMAARADQDPSITFDDIVNKIGLEEDIDREFSGNRSQGRVDKGNFRRSDVYSVSQFCTICRKNTDHVNSACPFGKDRSSNFPNNINSGNQTRGFSNQAQGFSNRGGNFPRAPIQHGSNFSNGNNNSNHFGNGGRAHVIKCYQCQGVGHVARFCPNNNIQSSDVGQREHQQFVRAVFHNPKPAVPNVGGFVSSKFVATGTGKLAASANNVVSTKQVSHETVDPKAFAELQDNVRGVMQRLDHLVQAVHPKADSQTCKQNGMSVGVIRMPAKRESDSLDQDCSDLFVNGERVGPEDYCADTGSFTNLIDSWFLMTLKPAPKLLPYTSRIFTVSSAEVTCIGSVDLYVKLNDVTKKIRFHVKQDLGYKVLLGMPAMAMWEVKLVGPKGINLTPLFKGNASEAVRLIHEGVSLMSRRNLEYNNLAMRANRKSPTQSDDDVAEKFCERVIVRDSAYKTPPVKLYQIKSQFRVNNNQLGNSDSQCQPLNDNQCQVNDNHQSRSVNSSQSSCVRAVRDSKHTVKSMRAPLFATNRVNIQCFRCKDFGHKMNQCVAYSGSQICHGKQQRKLEILRMNRCKPEVPNAKRVILDSKHGDADFQVLRSLKRKVSIGRRSKCDLGVKQMVVQSGCDGSKCDFSVVASDDLRLREARGKRHASLTSRFCVRKACRGRVVGLVDACRGKFGARVIDVCQSSCATEFSDECRGVDGQSSSDLIGLTFARTGIGVL